MSIHDYERANTLFSKSTGYKDTDVRRLECNYQRSVQAAQDGDYKKAVSILHSKVGDYKDALEKKAQYEKKILSSARIGDTVLYGNGRWIVADSDRGAEKKLLLVQKNPRKPEMAYHASGTQTAWENSDMRRWLNEDFYASCFSEFERRDVLRTEIATAANSAYGTGGSSRTMDYVFLLDETEAERYQSLLKSRKNQKAWWLRTPGKSAESTAFVSADGTVMRYGYASDSKDICVRPAVWVRGS